jgi:hypothetical protein
MVQEVVYPLVLKKNGAGFFRLASHERSAPSIYTPLINICSG